MTPRQARVALGAFVLLATGVTGNALYLQGGERAAARPPAAAPRPEPPRPPAAPPAAAGPAAPAQNKPIKPPHRASSSEPPPEAPKTAQSVKVRMVRVATVGDTTQEEGEADTVRAVQTELNRLGYGPVVADGVMRPAARAAIMAFEQEHRLALTGQATQGILKLLLFGAPASAGAAGPVEVRSPQAEAMIRQVQQMLGERGYRPGAVDGRLSAETVAAIRAFEADQGLVPKGRISAAVLERLEGGIGGGGRHKEP
ncbi:MAG TPA: peptidoglycan-binding protein [Hyphomicrobiaceae bacterium]|jgi:peptidoglycan hydrolase-like protein with peptidoglycan-binding domain